MYPIKSPAGDYLNPPPGRCWGATEREFEGFLADDLVYWPNEGRGRPRIKRFKLEEGGLVPSTWWTAKECGDNQRAKKELLNLFDADEVSMMTPKPEALLERIIHIATDPEDIVLDFFAGSGTTAAVAHKMDRRWIGIEQMDYINDLTSIRLKKVVEGEQGGISEAVDWSGGGGFIRADLLAWNETFVSRIRDASSIDDLNTIREDMLANGYLRHDLSRDELESASLDDLSIEDAQALLIGCLDLNHLYVNIGDMDDPTYGVSDDEQRLNLDFQEGEA